MVNTLIFGGTGLIGSYLINNYSKKRNFILISRNSPLQQNIQWIKCDLLNNIPFINIPRDINEVIYLAQYPNYRNFPSNALEMFRINTESFLQVLDFCEKNNIKNIVYASSGGIYGKSSKAFREENWYQANQNGWSDSTNPLMFYYKTKLMAEMIADSYVNQLKIAVLRFFFVYGETPKLSTFIMRLIYNIYNGIPITLDGNEGIKINPIHASDASDAIIFCLEKGAKGAFNICGKEKLFLKNIAEIIGKHLGKKPIFQRNETILNPCIIGNSDKIKKLGWEPCLKFEQEIKKIISFFLEHPQKSLYKFE